MAAACGRMPSPVLPTAHRGRTSPMINTTVLTRAGSMLAWRRHRPVLHVASAALRAVRTAHSASPRPRPFPCPASFASRAKRRFVSMGEAVVGHAVSVQQA